MKKIKYLLEAFVLYIFFYVFKILPPERASKTGAALLKTIGPHLGISRKAKRQLIKCFPDKSEKEITDIEKSMWENLGHIFGEYPHLEYLVNNKLRFTNDDLIKQLIAENKPAVLFSAHMGNWELNAPSTLLHFGKAVDATYRPLNNPYADKLLRKARTLNGRIDSYPKSRTAALSIIKALKNGHFIGILIDQKFNEGPSVPFFGMPAKTNPAFVEICQRQNIPFIPAQNIRHQDGTFEIKFFPPLQLFKADGSPIPVNIVLKEVNAYIETWIKEHPAQWLWLHNRWSTKT